MTSSSASRKAVVTSKSLQARAASWFVPIEYSEQDFKPSTHAENS
eukprot:CAMPEP_0175322548 /NCGR_PEP_ID=MMETSP0093-20121207/72529_1 /TAXON_ID=311494 /ORGANISM="Alexandrium monilatum, Strain CCMP3105" /LENGTH=44 /DNA_ID= /DNA_START= /DNA_END= /DNA_ORIENTATION=